MASPPETCAIASMRAACTRSSPRSVTRRSMPSFHCLRSWSVQKSACIVCAGVRFVLSNLPSSLTWLKSSAYSSLVSGFGPSGRNCDALSSASGVIPGRRRPTIGGGGLPGLGLPDPRERRRRSECYTRASAVVLAECNDCLRHALANHNAVRLRFAVRDRVHVGVIDPGEGVRLSGVKATRQAYQRVVRCGCDGGCRRGVRRDNNRRIVLRVELIA